MRLLIFALLQVLVFLPIASFATDNIKTPDTQKIHKAGITETYGKLPLSFIKNKGQVDKAVKFYEKGAGHSTFFTEDGVVLTLTKSDVGEEEKTSPIDTPLKEVKDRKFTTEALRLSFVGANNGVKVTSSSPLPGHVNYFVGNDKSKWHSNIPTYKAVTYKNVYNNIDVKFYGNNRDIEHDIIVRPGADPSVVRFAYEGIEGLKIRDNGDLELSLDKGKIIEKRPIIYQVIKGERKNVEGSYRIFKGKNGAFTYGYTVASYDQTKKLVIDPVLVYSTYLGGSDWDTGHAIAVDASGSAYVTGATASIDFPLVNPIQGVQGANNGSLDVFVTKINSSGSAIIYSTYLGGASIDYGLGIAIDATGTAYIIGETLSTDFPLASPIQGVKGNSWDAFVTKIDPAGSSLLYSTYLGGSDEDRGWDIIPDASGNAYITGITLSTDFPIVSPIQGSNGGVNFTSDVFVTKINSAGTALVYSTYLGGSQDDYGISIALDSSDNAYITGWTNSTNFPLASPIQGSKAGILLTYDAFVTKINSTGTAITYSTYLGGSQDDNGNSITIDSSGNAYITGGT